MLANILKNSLFIGVLAIFIFSVGGSLLYMRHVQRVEAEKLAETEARVRQWNEKQKPIPAEAPVVEQTPQGHFDNDGTFHAEPHETPQPSPEINTPQVSSRRRAGSDVAPRRLPEDVFSAEYTAQVKAAVQTCVSLFHASDEEREAGGGHLAFAKLGEASNDARRLSKLAYRMDSPSYQVRADEIDALMEPFDVLIPKPKLDADQLVQVDKAAQEFETIRQQLGPAEQQRLRALGIDNPYRTRLEEEQNR